MLERKVPKRSLQALCVSQLMNLEGGGADVRGRSVTVTVLQVYSLYGVYIVCLRNPVTPLNF